MALPRWRFALVASDDSIQEMGRRFNQRKSQMQPASEGNQADSTAHLTFKASESWDVDAGLMYWGGLADPTTSAWVDNLAGMPQPLYGGYVLENEDNGAGARHRMPLTLTGFAWDLDTTVIPIWPDPSTLDAAVPVGKTVADWLTGDPIPGTSYQGLLPAFLGGDGGWLTNIDPALGALTFDADVRPGTPQREQRLNGGAWGAVTLRKALDDIGIAIRFKALPDLVDPIMYPDVVIDPDDPTRLRPRFNLVNVLDVSGPSVATFSVTPTAGQYAIEQDDFAHHRDDRDARQRILVKGAGTEGGALVMATAYVAGRPRQGTRYQTDPGRATILINEDIRTIAECQAIADLIEAVSWGAAGWVRFTAKVYFPVGAIVTLHVPQAGFTNQKFRVTRIQNLGRLGTPKWQYFLGNEPPDLSALFAQASHKVHALSQLGRLVPGSGWVVGAPAGAYHNNSPIHSQQNMQQGRDGVTARTTLPAFVEPGGTRTAGTIREAHQDQAGNIREWIDDATGLDALIRVPMDFSAAGTISWQVDEPGTIRRILISDGAIGVMLTLDSDPAINPDVYERAATPGDPPTLIAAGDPLPILEGHTLAVTVDGACQLTLSGRGPLL